MTCSSFRLVCLAALLAPAVASAQSSVVVPAGAGVSSPLDKSEGNDDFHLPGRNAPSRILGVYRTQDWRIPKSGLTITGVALRRDGAKTTAFKDHIFSSVS